MENDQVPDALLEKRGEHLLTQGRDLPRKAGVDVILKVDRHGFIHGASGNTRVMLARTLWSVEGSKLDSVLDAPSATRVYSRMDEVFNSGVTAPAVSLSGLTALSGDGTTISVEAVLTALEEEGDEEPSLLITLKTHARSTARRHRERQARERLESSNRDLEAFASVAAHDLQEPLRKIRAFSDRIAHSVQDGDLEAITRYLGRIDHSAGRMQGLIDDLLKLARVSGQEPKRERLDLTKLMLDIGEDLAPSNTDDVRIDITEIPDVIADPVQMRQLFENLINNALKFRRDEVSLCVAVRGRQEEDRVRIDVTDNGIGFDDRYLDKIFEPFERLHGRSEYEGSGIGLALCRAIAERHGGTIDAHGQPGQGATFEVVLPAADAQ